MKIEIAFATILLAAAFARGSGVAAPSELKVSADLMAADNKTATLVASGNVYAVAAPLRLMSDLAEKRGDEYRFAPGTLVTTCTNEACSLHWSAAGEVRYHGAEGDRYVVVKDVTFRAFGVPVAWLPFWYYPLDTDYGWRVMPGYSSRWGAYLLTKYVYGIAGSFEPGAWGLSGSTRLDLRSKRGVAFGQGLGWQLGDFGRGRLKVYYANDLDADTYDHHWSGGRHWHYENWGSEVHDDRYAAMLEHRWDATERDVVRVRGSVYSDSHFRSDFLRDGLFGHSNRYIGHNGNELAWEHLESRMNYGASVTGPLECFYGGVSRLPEFFLDVMPQPVFGLPANYESSLRAGFLNRDYGRRGNSLTSTPYRYAPGEWADYQAFRLDTYHRLTLPFKVADALSVVPRVGARGTYWSASGREVLDGYGRAGSARDDVWRTIVEGGATLAARGTADFDGGWRHVVEPYLDFLAQKADYHGVGGGRRPLVFDSVDASRDWLDQFAGRSRNLPYSWQGVTPGFRNAFFRQLEDGRRRMVFDFDVYASVQFNDTGYTEGSPSHRLVRDPADPNYGHRRGAVVPGFRTRWSPVEGARLGARVEYDVENECLAYADVAWNQELSKDLKLDMTFSSRDHRWWDFSSSPYDPSVQRNEDFNRARFSSLYVGFEHEICDALAWGPFVRWDCRESELDEIGAWFDLRTDCLGFRFSVSYENDYERIDRSVADDDWRFGFFVYLRALGPDSGSPF